MSSRRGVLCPSYKYHRIKNGGYRINDVRTERTNQIGNPNP